MPRTKVNDRTFNLIRRFEGLHRLKGDGSVHVYPDAGYGWKWATQGYGTTVNPDTGKKLHRGSPPINKGTAERWLRADIESKYAPRVARLVKVPLSPDSFGALVSFAYNCGTGALARSTLLKRVNARRFSEVPGQFMRWNKSNGRVFRGLSRRRKDEAAQFMEGLNQKPSSTPEAGPPVAIPLPTKNPIHQRGNTSWLLRAFLSWFR